MATDGTWRLWSENDGERYHFNNCPCCYRRLGGSTPDPFKMCKTCTRNCSSYRVMKHLRKEGH